MRIRIIYKVTIDKIFFVVVDLLIFQSNTQYKVDVNGKISKANFYKIKLFLIQKSQIKFVANLCHYLHNLFTYLDFCLYLVLIKMKYPSTSKYKVKVVLNSLSSRTANDISKHVAAAHYSSKSVTKQSAKQIVDLDDSELKVKSPEVS